MHGGEERRGVFGIAGSNAAPPLKLQEGIFNEVVELVERFIISSGFFAIFAWRNHNLCALRFGFFDDGIAVIAFVRQQVFHREAVDQVFRHRTIRTGAFGHDGANRQTMRIYGEMDFCVEPPFVRPIA